MVDAIKITKSRVFAFVFLVLILAGGTALYLNFLKDRESIKALTEKKRYSANEELKVKVENNSEKKVCFSSCYPFLIQTKGDGWNNYNYPNCDKENVAESCIDSKGLKAFGISLSEMYAEPALHRLAIPACIDCAMGEQFRVDKILYSNEFEIKK